MNGDHRLVKAKNCRCLCISLTAPIATTTGVVIPHMGSADWDTRKKMAELCVRNAINGAKGEDLVAEVKM